MLACQAIRFADAVTALKRGNYQTLINQALRSFIHQKQESLEATLRRVIREEIRRAG